MGGSEERDRDKPSLLTAWRSYAVSCVFFTLSFWTGVSSQELEQSPRSLTIQEGEDFTINCSSSKTLYTLHWYRQKNGEGLSFLMLLQKRGEEKSHEKITAKMDEKMQQSFLHVTASQPSHSGIYLCAADALWSPDLRRLSPNMQLGHRGSADTGLWRGSCTLAKVRGFRTMQ